MLSNTLRLNFWHKKIIGILHPLNHLTITGHILKNKQKNKHFYIHEIMQVILMKMKTKMKIDSRKCGINRPRCSTGTNIVNIWSVSKWWCLYVLSNTEAELNKSVAYRKSVYPGNDAQHCWSRIYDKHYA